MILRLLRLTFNAKDSANPQPQFLRIQDPFANLPVRARGDVIINEAAIFQAAEEEGK